MQPRFDYCTPVWDGLSSNLCEKPQKLQNRAARAILQANCEVNSGLLLETYIEVGPATIKKKKAESYNDV